MVWVATLIAKLFLQDNITQMLTPLERHRGESFKKLNSVAAPT